MANICQDDFAVVRPGDYFPETFRDGTCDACGAQTFVARVSKDEVERAARALRSVASQGLFRTLSPEEEADFRQWARDNWTAGNGETPSALWHPVVRDEIARMEAER